MSLNILSLKKGDRNINRKRKQTLFEFFWIPVIAVLVIWGLTLPLEGTKLFTVRGTVTDDETKEPMSGGIVFLGDTFVSTQPNGTYEILAKPGIHLLNVSAEGYKSHEEQLTINENLILNVALIPLSAAIQPASGSTIITGKVTDVETGLPVTGATVTANLYRTRTGSGGTYSLKVTKGTYNLNVAAKGYETKTATVEASEEKTYTVDVVVKSLPPAPTIALTAPNNLFTFDGKTLVFSATVKRADGTPAAGVVVSFRSLGDIFGKNPNFPKGTFDSETAMTDATGKASATWTCLEEISTGCGRKTTLAVTFAASARVEDKSIEDQIVVNVGYKPCGSCHAVR